MLAFHSDPAIKARYLARVAGHAEADEIIKGQYWEAGKGCAVGCTVHGEAHAAFEAELGIPIMLAWLEDVIFEGLPNRLAKTWPERFLSAIEPGADLSVVGWRLLHWLLTESGFGECDHPLVADAVARCAALLRRAIDGLSLDTGEVQAAARLAAEAAGAAEQAGALAAAWMAESGARAAESLADRDAGGELAAMAVTAAIARSMDYVAVSEALLALLRAQQPLSVRQRVGLAAAPVYASAAP